MRRYSLQDPEVLAVLQRAAQEIPVESDQPTAKQVAYALGLGIDPHGCTKWDLIRMIDAVKNAWIGISSNELLQRNRYIAHALRPHGSGIRIGDFDDAQVTAYVQQRYRELQQEFPVGSSVQFSWPDGTTRVGIVIHYYWDEIASESYRTFTLKGEKQTSHHSITSLVRAEKLHDVVDPFWQHVDALQARIAGMVKEKLQPSTVDFVRPMQQVTTIVITRLLRRAGFDPKTIDEDELHTLVSKELRVFVAAKM